MSNKFKITKIIEFEYEDSKLEFQLNLPLGVASSPKIKFSYTCPKCGGYGCHNTVCDSYIYLENNNNIRKIIGDEQSDLLIQCLQRLIEKINE